MTRAGRSTIAFVAVALLVVACSTTTNNPTTDTTTTTATIVPGTTTSSVGTRPGPAPGVSTQPVPLDTSFIHADAPDLDSRPPDGTPRPGATLPEVKVGSITSANAYFAEGPEQEFREFTNQDRAIVGAPLVARDQYLDDYARAHAQAMGQAGGIYHSNINVLLCCYWTVGENVGIGPTARAIQYAYEASFGHFANLTDATFSRMGIGVYIDEAGRMWTVSEFAG